MHLLSPSATGFSFEVAEWRWSSYKSTAYAGKVPEYLTIERVLGQFAEQKNTARQRYRKFVAESLVDQARPWQKLTGQVFFGSENFVSRMCELLGDKQEIKEISRAQRYPGRPPLDRFFADIPAGNRQHCNKRVMEAHITHGYTLKEIADRLGIHYTTVSKIVAGNRKN
jgi:hypothetical protein